MKDQTIPPASLFRLFNRMGGWIVIVLGVMLVLITLVSQLALNTAQRFEAEGVAATATVEEKYTTTSTDSDGDTTTSYWLTFRFVTADKREMTLTETVGTSLYRQVSPGDTFELLYLRSDPERVETSPGSNRAASLYTQISALVFGLLWLVGLWRVGSWAVAAVRARKYGARETVRLTGIERSGVRINNRPRYRLTWKDSQGRAGKSLLQPKDRIRDLSGGDRIDIYRGLKTGWWVGDVGERSND